VTDTELLADESSFMGWRCHSGRQEPPRASPAWGDAEVRAPRTMLRCVEVNHVPRSAGIVETSCRFAIAVQILQ